MATKTRKAGTIITVKHKTYITREDGKVIPYALQSKLAYLRVEVGRVQSIPDPNGLKRRQIEARLAELNQKIEDAEQEAGLLDISSSLDAGVMVGR
jgi:hypothetical protein